MLPSMEAFSEPSTISGFAEANVFASFPNMGPLLENTEPRDETAFPQPFAPFVDDRAFGPFLGLWETPKGLDKIVASIRPKRRKRKRHALSQWETDHKNKLLKEITLVFDHMECISLYLKEKPAEVQKPEHVAPLACVDCMYSLEQAEEVLRLQIEESQLVRCMHCRKGGQTPKQYAESFGGLQNVPRSGRGRLPQTFFPDLHDRMIQLRSSLTKILETIHRTMASLAPKTRPKKGDFSMPAIVWHMHRAIRVFVVCPNPSIDNVKRHIERAKDTLHAGDQKPFESLASTNRHFYRFMGDSWMPLLGVPVIESSLLFTPYRWAVMMKASRKIEAGEQIFYDYGSEYDMDGSSPGECMVEGCRNQARTQGFCLSCLLDEKKCLGCGELGCEGVGNGTRRPKRWCDGCMPKCNGCRAPRYDILPCGTPRMLFPYCPTCLEAKRGLRVMATKPGSLGLFTTRPREKGDDIAPYSALKRHTIFRLSENRDDIETHRRTRRFSDCFEYAVWGEPDSLYLDSGHPENYPARFANDPRMKVWVSIGKHRIPGAAYLMSAKGIRTENAHLPERIIHIDRPTRISDW